MQPNLQHQPHAGGGSTKRAAQPEVSLADFRVSPRVLLLILMATVVGAFGTLAAWALVKLIALATNLAYYGHFSFASVSVTATPLGI